MLLSKSLKLQPSTLAARFNGRTILSFDHLSKILALASAPWLTNSDDNHIDKERRACAAAITCCDHSIVVAAALSRSTDVPPLARVRA